tara:strand:+ start:271 stop:510 length:240 start_codon:yes stop_codon:yes gene_type:complete
MTLPTSATRTHLQSGTSDPKQARVELHTLIGKFNDLLTHLNSVDFADNGMGDGLSISSGNIKVDITSSDTVTIDCGGLS